VLASPFLWIFSLCYEVILQMQDSRKKKKIIYGLDGLRVHDVRAFLTAESWCITWQEGGNLCLSGLSPNSYKATWLQTWGSTKMDLSNTNHFPKASPLNTIVTVSILLIPHNGDSIIAHDAWGTLSHMHTGVSLLPSTSCCTCDMRRHTDAASTFPRQLPPCTTLTPTESHTLRQRWHTSGRHSRAHTYPSQTRVHAHLAPTVFWAIPEVAGWDLYLGGSSREALGPRAHWLWADPGKLEAGSQEATELFWGY
jgi:hypothetical protein